MKNIVFDLGGVLFARDKHKCSPEFIDFFRFIRTDPMPDFWVEYDRGTLTLDQVVDALCALHGCTPEVARATCGRRSTGRNPCGRPSGSSAS